MPWVKNIWVSKKKRREQLDHHMIQKIACFGYRQIPQDEKIKWVLRHFNTVADKYDFMNTLLSFGIHHLWKRTAVRMLGLKEGDWVIDVCGGTGDLSLLAAKSVGLSGRVILYDFNEKMMKAGRAKVDGSPFRKCIWYVRGDAEQISFPNRKFDAAMVGFGIRNLTDMEKGFREMYRVLKPDGKMICLEFSKPTAPLFRWLYDMYSFYVMPRLGELIMGSRPAYAYLPESIRMFPLPDELANTMKKIGFAHITHHKLTNGIAVVHMAKKKSPL
jgi:demethylmenaquinone methyltransferase/2-methoxy-6-polyprenyl-1,4-benzoquinol methylase